MKALREIKELKSIGNTKKIQINVFTNKDDEIRIERELKYACKEHKIEIVNN